MTTEWKDITDPEELFRLKREGWEIELYHGANLWSPWKGLVWNNDWKFRAKPPKPKAKMTKFLGWVSPTEIMYEITENSDYCLVGYSRVPSRDFEAEVIEP
jgi:hypothetical protein